MTQNIVHSITVTCPDCRSSQVLHDGTFDFEIDLEECENPECPGHIYSLLAYDCNGCNEEILIQLAMLGGDDGETVGTHRA